MLENNQKLSPTIQDNTSKKPVNIPSGMQHVKLLGIIIITVYLLTLMLLSIYAMVQFWPPNVPPDSGKALPGTSFFTIKLSLSMEIRLLLIVASAGALGSIVHALRSLYWYVGHGSLLRRWILMYLLLPFSSAALSLVFYFVIRAGFFSPQANVQQTSPLGFVAVASLIGLFSQQAILKLKEVADTLFTKPKPGNDAKPQDNK